VREIKAFLHQNFEVNSQPLKGARSKRWVWWGMGAHWRTMFQTRFQMLHNAFIMKSTAK